MAGTIIDMSKIKQLLYLKKAGVSNRQIAKDLKMLVLFVEPLILSYIISRLSAL